MPRDITVTFVDGSSHVYNNAPDNITPEQVSERATSEFGKVVKALDGGRKIADTPQDPALGDEAKKVLNFSLRGGALSGPELGSMLGKYTTSKVGNKLADTLLEKSKADKIKAFIAMSDLLPFLKNLTGGELKRPDTTAGQYAGEIGRGAVSAVTPGSKADMVKSMITGGSAGGGSELAAKLFGDNPFARIIGSLVGGTVGGLTGSATMLNTKDLAREATRDARPVDVAKAIDESNMAHQYKVDTLPQQHMTRGSNLTAYVDTLANNAAGVNVTNKLRNQSAQVSILAEDMLGEVPGTVRPKAIVANNMQEAATDILSDLKRVRTDGWAKKFDEVAQMTEASGKVQPAVVEKIQETLGKLADEFPNSAQSNWLNDLSSKLTVTKTFDDVVEVLSKNKLLDAKGNPTYSSTLKTQSVTQQVPMTEVKQIDRILREMRDGLKNVNLATNMNAAGNTKYLAGQIKDIRETLGNASEPYKAANTWYKQFTDEVYNIVKKYTPIGKLAGRSGAIDDKEGPVGYVFKLLDNGTIPGSSSSEIKTVAEQFRKHGKEAVFDDLVKTWFATGIDKALATTTRELPDDIAKQLSKYFGAFATETSKMQGMRDILSSVAANQKMTKSETADYIKGFENMIKIFNAAAKRPAAFAGTSSKEVLETAGKGVFNRLGQFSIMTPLRQPMLAWSSLVQHNSLKEIDRLISSSEGMETLMKLGKAPEMSQIAANILATFMETAVSASDSAELQNNN